jgi:hypothetical protein
MFQESRLANAFVLQECTKANSCWGFVEQNCKEYEEAQTLILTIIFATYYQSCKIEIAYGKR